jgi:hypothetical protein
MQIYLQREVALLTLVTLGSATHHSIRVASPREVRESIHNWSWGRFCDGTSPV